MREWVDCIKIHTCSTNNVSQGIQSQQATEGEQLYMHDANIGNWGFSNQYQSYGNCSNICAHAAFHRNLY